MPEVSVWSHATTSSCRLTSPVMSTVSILWTSSVWVDSRRRTIDGPRFLASRNPSAIAVFPYRLLHLFSYSTISTKKKKVTISRHVLPRYTFSLYCRVFRFSLLYLRTCTYADCPFLFSHRWLGAAAVLLALVNPVDST